MLAGRRIFGLSVETRAKRKPVPGLGSKGNPKAIRGGRLVVPP